VCYVVFSGSRGLLGFPLGKHSAYPKSQLSPSLRAGLFCWKTSMTSPQRFSSSLARRASPWRLQGAGCIEDGYRIALDVARLPVNDGDHHTTGSTGAGANRRPGGPATAKPPTAPTPAPTSVFPKIEQPVVPRTTNARAVAKESCLIKRFPEAGIVGPRFLSFSESPPLTGCKKPQSFSAARCCECCQAVRTPKNRNGVRFRHGLTRARGFPATRASLLTTAAMNP